MSIADLPADVWHCHIHPPSRHIHAGGMLVHYRLCKCDYEEAERRLSQVCKRLRAIYRPELAHWTILRASDCELYYYCSKLARYPQLLFHFQWYLETQARPSDHFRNSLGRNASIEMLEAYRTSGCIKGKWSGLIIEEILRRDRADLVEWLWRTCPTRVCQNSQKLCRLAIANHAVNALQHLLRLEWKSPSARSSKNPAAWFAEAAKQRHIDALVCLLENGYACPESSILKFIGSGNRPLGKLSNIAKLKTILASSTTTWHPRTRELLNRFFDRNSRWS